MAGKPAPKFHITREQVETVVDGEYTQSDYSRDVGPHSTNYNVSNDWATRKEALQTVALVMEVAARQAVGNFEPLHLPELIDHLNF